MKKIYGLFFLLILLPLNMFSQPVEGLNSPSTSPQKTLHKQILYIEKNYTSQPDTVVKLIQYIVKVPDSIFPLEKKITFLKLISKKLEISQNYRQALSVLKTADSLILLSHSTTSIIKSHTKNFSFPFFFAFFVVLLILVSYWLFYKIHSLQKLQKQLKQTEKKIVQTQQMLQEAEKETDRLLHEQASDLQKELKNLRDEETNLKSQLKKIEEANYLRNTFIANLGFDVRTPLSGIIGFANMLETELAIKENKELYDYAAAIKKSSNRLLKLLDNIIDLSALESNQLTLKIKPVAAEKIFRKVFDQYQPLAQEKNLIFKIKIEKELKPVLSDEKGLEKVFLQLTDNAIKYTEKGFVTLSANYSEETDTDVFEIKDTGPGISIEKQKVIFNENLTETSDESTGIGLRLTKKYVEMMKGSLFLHSIPGKGTTLSVHLPCSEKAIVNETSPEEIPENEITPAITLGNLDIFVVEDDRMNRLILEKMLKPLGKVKLTVDGDDCLQTIEKEAQKNHFYQVMLFDINLPGDWDGIKLLKTIREKYPEYRKVPFIAQTAYAMAGDKERLLQEGFDSYLSKPIDKNELITTIKQQLSIFKNPDLHRLQQDK